MNKELPTPFKTETLFHESGDRLVVELFQGIGDPRVLFVSKIHLNELQVAGRQRTHINRRIITGDFPLSHVRVFQVCPENSNDRYLHGLDLNRQFLHPLEPLIHSRASLLRELTTQFPIEYIFSSHQYHPKRDTKGNLLEPHRPFHFYHIDPSQHEVGHKPLVRDYRNRLISSIKSAGYDVYSGPDDPDISPLSFEDGYLYTPAFENIDHTFETDAVLRGALGTKTVVKEAYVFEISEQLPLADKKRQVEITMDEFALPYVKTVLPVA